MNKYLLASALTATMIHPALAADIPITLYGIIDAGVETKTGQSDGYTSTGKALGRTNYTDTKLGSGLYIPSKLGVKGDLEIAPGLDAYYALETGLCTQGGGGATTFPSSGGSTNTCTGGGFFGELEQFGLKGDFGKVEAGRLYSNTFLNALTADPFHDGTSGAEYNLNAPSLAYIRLSQNVTYTTPTLNGVTGMVGYAFNPKSSTGANSGNYSTGHIMEANVSYAGGPVMAGAGYLQNTGVVGGTGSGQVSIAQLFGSYDFGSVKLSALYESTTGDITSSALGPISTNFMVNTGQLSLRFYLLGAAIPLGKGTLLASYDSVNDTNTSSSTAHQYAIGYTYPLAKTLTAYASLSHITNSSNTYFGGGNATDLTSGTLGTSANAAMSGLNLQF